MGIVEIFLIGVSLSMDAFAISVCKGLSQKKTTLRHCLTAGAYFGIFQALMPLIGYFLAGTVAAKIAGFSHYIAFGLLLLIGGNMIRESFSGEDGDDDPSMSFRVMIPLAVATSIDAFAVGVSFALVDVNIVPAVILIGATTFVISGIGIKLGGFVGSRFSKAAGIAGGAVLVLLGIKILLEGIGII